MESTDMLTTVLTISIRASFAEIGFRPFLWEYKKKNFDNYIPLQLIHLFFLTSKDDTGTHFQEQIHSLKAPDPDPPEIHLIK